MLTLRRCTLTLQPVHPYTADVASSHNSTNHFLELAADDELLGRLGVEHRLGVRQGRAADVHLSAVDDEDRAGHVRGGRGEEVDGGVANVDRLAEARERDDAGDDGSLRALGDEAERALGVGNGAGRMSVRVGVRGHRARLRRPRHLPRSHDVRTDTTRTLLDRNDLAERVDGSLGGAHVRLVRHAAVVQRRRDVEVRALRLADVGEGRLDRVVCAELGERVSMSSVYAALQRRSCARPATTHSVNLNDGAERVLAERRDGREEVTRGA